MELFSGIRQTASLLVLLIAVFLLPQSLVFGQATTGSVIGTVADSTGAVIPKAAVTLSDQQTGITRKTVTNDLGGFAFASVVPSTSYKIEITAPNFRTWESQLFTLLPGDSIAFSDIKLQVGLASEQVTVESENSTVKALDTGERSDVINAQMLNTVAVVGRDATELVRVLPGFQMSSGNQGLDNRPGYNTAVVGMSGATGSFSANGSGINGIAVVSDGVSLTDIGGNSGTVQNATIDGVAELKASTSSFSAENAKGPAVINVVGKSGTSSFHGSGYFYGRDTVFNSNDWYDNFLQQTRPAGRYMYPGGTLGGPVLLPFTSFNRNRDKMFFFALFEYRNQLFEANSQPQAAWVPTMSERKGDFSFASLDAELCGARPDGKANPNAIQPLCYSENYLPNGTVVSNYNVAPYANSSGAALVNWLPLPNADPFTNQFGYNYIQQVMQNQNGEQFHGRIDYNISDNDKVFVSYGLQREIDQQPVAFNSFPTSGMPYPGDIETGDISSIISAQYTRIFGPMVTNEVTAAMSFVSFPGKMVNPEAVSRFDMNSYNCTSPSERATGSCGSSGKGNFNYLGMYKNGGDYSIPALSDYANLGYPNMLMPGGFYNNQVRMKKAVPDVQDTLSWMKGNHFLKFGIYYEKGILNGLADYGAFPQGEFTFNPSNTYFEYSTLASTSAQFVGCETPNQAGNQRLSGAAYLGSCMNPTALMFLGYADTYSQANFSPIVNMQYTTLSGFVNDTWRIRRLSLTLGARVEHLGPWVDRHGNGLATFSPTLYSEQCSGYTRNCNSLNMPGVTWHSLGSGVKNSVNSPATVYFTPRIGAAWDVFGKGNTVLRGGWGIYRAEEEFNPYALAAATAQGYKSSLLQGPLTFDYIDSHSPLNPPDFSAYTITQSDTNRPVHYEYNVTVSQRAPWKSFLEVSYVGSDNVNLSSYNHGNYNSASDINKMCGIVTGCPANPNPENPTNNLFTVNLGDLPASMTSNGTGQAISNLSSPEQDFYRPYPYYQHVYRLNHNYYAKYNSLQVTWNKQTGIIQYGANYTFSKNLATAASWNNVIPDPVNLGNDYNPVPYDRTHTVNVTYLIDLGRRYRGGNKILKDAANGWQISGISSIMSGFPLASVQGENFGFGYGQILPVQVEYLNQLNPGQIPTCASTYLIPPDKNGHTYCVTQMNPTVWLGTPDVQLMATVTCNPAKGSKKNQFINPLCFGLPLPGTNGQYRPPYMHGPAFMDHDLSLLKNLSMGHEKNLQLRMAAFNFLNHPLVSFNQQDTTNLTLAFQNATAGKALAQSALTHPDFGIANIKVGNRLVELSVKYEF